MVGKRLADITVDDIERFRATRGKHLDTNSRINELGDVLDIIIAGTNKMPSRDPKAKTNNDYEDL